LAFYKFGLFNHIRETHGLLSSVLSYRDQLVIEKTWPYILDNWSFVNYFVGGLSDFNIRSQMDFIDVFLFWGILGGILYLITFYKSFVVFTIDKMTLYFIVFLIFIIFLAGNFFTYTTIPIYLLIIRERIFNNSQRA
jgi:hypothetical protein